MMCRLPRLPRNRKGSPLSSGLKGRLAESLALAYFLLHGYFPARRPFRALAQTDLLLRKGHVLVLVEVKYRKNIEAAHLALQQVQTQRLHRQLAALAAQNPLATLRLDLFLVFPQFPWVQHIPALDLPAEATYHTSR